MNVCRKKNVTHYPITAEIFQCRADWLTDSSGEAETKTHMTGLTQHFVIWFCHLISSRIILLTLAHTHTECGWAPKVETTSAVDHFEEFPLSTCWEPQTTPLFLDQSKNELLLHRFSSQLEGKQPVCVCWGDWNPKPKHLCPPDAKTLWLWHWEW